MILFLIDMINSIVADSIEKRTVRNKQQIASWLMIAMQINHSVIDYFTGVHINGS